MDFDFSSDLLFDFSLLQFAFVEDFEGADEACRALFGQVHSPKFAFPQGLPYFKHAEMEILGFCLLLHLRIR